MSKSLMAMMSSAEICEYCDLCRQECAFEECDSAYLSYLETTDDDEGDEE